MKLESRIARLESLLPAPQREGASAQKLSDFLETLMERLQGQTEDRLNASVAERVALAFNRGDGEFAKKLLHDAVERQKQTKRVKIYD